MKKLGLFVMPLMAVSLLASCGGNSPKNTYTIDFQGENCSSNLDLSKQYHTGDQVEFTIEVAPDSYKLPDKINVSGVSKFEYSNQTGAVSFTVESKDIGVIAKADVIKPTVQHTVTFVLNGATSPQIEPVKVHECSPYPSDKIPANPTNPGHTFEGWSDNEKKKSIVDLTKYTVNSDLILYAWWGDAQTVKITFDANGGYFDEDISKTTVDVDTSYGQIPVPPTPTKKVAGQTLSFKGWDKALVAATSETTYTAQWDNAYTITITGDNVDEQTLTFVAGQFNPITVSVTVAPNYKLTGKYTLSKSDSAIVDFVDTKTLSITPKINDNFVVTLETKEDTRYYYSITTHGTFITYYKDEEMKVELDHMAASVEEDLVFYMVADHTKNSEGYIPPTTLDIKAGNLPIPYTIEDVSGTYQNVMKKVTISKENITGDISINGNAVQVDYYNVVFPYFYKLKELPYEKTVFKYDSEATIEFEASDSISNDEELLTAENIYVNFTGGDEDWIWAADDAFEDKGKFEHTEDNKYILTINANVVDPEKINTIQIIARAKSYHKILDLFSWDEISQMSGTPLATRLFDCGDTKTTNKKTFRIIDFNKDELAESTNEDPKYAGITFECVNSLDTSYWNINEGDKSKNYNFISSTLNIACQEDGNIYNAMPAGIKPFIKTVTKYAEISNDEGETYESTSYTTQLFPLSKEEIEGGYAYYQNGGSKAKGFDYWLRTPYDFEGHEYCAWYCHNDGNLFSDGYVDDRVYAVAPAFCI